MPIVGIGAFRAGDEWSLSLSIRLARIPPPSLSETVIHTSYARHVETDNWLIATHLILDHASGHEMQS